MAQMAQIAKVETSVQTKCSPDKVYDFLKNNLTKLAEMAPNLFQSIELLEGEEGCAGHVKHLKYNLGGPKSAKVRFDKIDDEEKCIEVSVLEGDVMQFYKSFKVSGTFVEANTVKWSIEFEKAIELAPAPDHYILMATQITHLLDGYFAI